MVYHCSFALCKNDSRHKHQPHMQGVKFHFFPHPVRDREKCLRWVAACQRPKFTIEKVTRTMVVCSKHFIGGTGPTEEFPDPLPDDIIGFETPCNFQMRKTAGERGPGHPFMSGFVGGNKMPTVGFEMPPPPEQNSSLLPSPAPPSFVAGFDMPATTSSSLSADTGNQDSGRDFLEDTPTPSAPGQETEGSATLLRSLLTDKGPQPPVTQASSSDSGTSSVDLGLITLAMLAVKSAAKSSGGAAQDQNKEQTNESSATENGQGGFKADEENHRCGCDCVFTSRYRLWLHQSANQPCKKCQKPCVPVPPPPSVTSSSSNSLLASALGKNSSRSKSGALPPFGNFSSSSSSTTSVFPGMSSGMPLSLTPSETYRRFYGGDNPLDSVLSTLHSTSNNMYLDPNTPQPTLTPWHLRGAERKTQISKALKGKVSNFLSKKALMARLDSILTPTLKTEEDDGACKCNLCGEEFELRSELKKHKQKIHWVGTPYQCDCGKSFSTYFGLDIHKRQRAGEKLFICRQCEFAFSSEADLQRHREKQHAGEKEPPPANDEDEKCTLGMTPAPGSGSGGDSGGGGGGGDTEETPEVNGVSTGPTDVGVRRRRRIKNSQKRYTCCYCQKVFRKFKEMVLHKKIHKGEKRFHCPICGKPCLQSSELKVHMRTHTGERPYACTMCDKRFSTTSALQSHTRIHTGEKPYACDYCDKRFSDKKYMKSHVRTHTGERRYQCSLCGKMFTQSCALTIHERLHTGNKPFSCDECGQKFVTNSYLQKHIQSVHTVKPLEPVKSPPLTMSEQIPPLPMPEPLPPLAAPPQLTAAPDLATSHHHHHHHHHHHPHHHHHQVAPPPPHLQPHPPPPPLQHHPHHHPHHHHPHQHPHPHPHPHAHPHPPHPMDMHTPPLIMGTGFGMDNAVYQHPGQPYPMHMWRP
ncbi:zinc finger protein 782 [Elysia marginata]|uniref:Zinc finger protein 782 n=1 Tax=Elysia marginata TaxID=1093978 RepID=A0AAV4H2J5_9GAST|nr:zinc finger protein 782 [Elysia marginata]